MKRAASKAVVAFVMGGLLPGAALAGTLVDPSGTATGTLDGLPVGPTTTTTAPAPGPGQGDEHRMDAEIAPEEIAAAAKLDVEAPSGATLPPGTFLVGAARASLAPAPESFGGDRW